MLYVVRTFSYLKYTLRSHALHLLCSVLYPGDLGRCLLCLEGAPQSFICVDYTSTWM